MNNTEANTDRVRPYHRRHLLAGIGASYVRNALAMVAGFVSTSCYVRYLGDADYGLWVTAFSVLGYLRLGSSSMAMTGASLAAAAHARGDDRELSRVLVTCSLVGFFCLAITTGGLIVALAFPAGRVWLLGVLGAGSSTAISVVLVLAIGGLISQPAETLRTAVRSLQRPDVEQYVYAVFCVIQPVAGIAVLACGGRGVALAVVTVATQAGIGIPLWFAMRRISPAVRLGPSCFDVNLARRFIAPSLQFFVIYLGGVLIWGTDYLVISAYLGSAAVTPYAVTVLLVNVSTNLVSSMMSPMAPTVSHLHALNETEKLRRILVVVLKFGLALTSLLVVGLACFGREFLRLWVGPSRIAPGMVLATLLAIFAIRTFGMFFEVVVTGTLSHRTYAAVVLCEGLLNFTLSVFLVQRIGVVGVALGTLIAHAACNGWYLPYKGMSVARCRFGEVFRGAVLPNLFSAAAAAIAAVLYLLIPLSPGWFHLVLGALVVTVAYALAFSLTGLGDNGFSILRSANRRFITS